MMVSLPLEELYSQILDTLVARKGLLKGHQEAQGSSQAARLCLYLSAWSVNFSEPHYLDALPHTDQSNSPQLHHHDTNGDGEREY